MAPTKLRQFRLSDDLIERFDRYVEHLKKTEPALPWTRSSALRLVLTEHLDAFEASPARKRPTRRRK